MLWDPLMKNLMQRVILYAVGINNMQRKRLNSGYLYPLRLYVFSKPYIGGKTTNIGKSKRVPIPPETIGMCFQNPILVEKPPI